MTKSWPSTKKVSECK